MGKPHATLSPLDHRGATHIKVEIANNNECKSLIRQVPGRKWSKTHGCWYAPYSPEAFRQLKELFEVAVPSEFTKPVKAPKPPAPKQAESPPIAEPIQIERENSKRIKAFVPADKKGWIEKIKTIPGRAWNMDKKYWSLPMVKSTFQFLEENFGDSLLVSFKVPTDLPMGYQPKNWQPGGTPPGKANKASFQAVKPQLVEIEKDGIKQKVVTGDFMVIEKEDGQWLRSYVPGDRKNWIEVVKNIPGRKWDPEGKFWLVPFVKKTFSYLERHMGNRVVFNVGIPEGLKEDFPELPATGKAKPAVPREPLSAFQN